MRDKCGYAIEKYLSWRYAHESSRCDHARALGKELWFLIRASSRGRPNVRTLSCKNRLTRLPHEAARRRPRLNPSGTAATTPRRPVARGGRGDRRRAGAARAVRAARGGSPPGQRTGGFCQLVRAVRRQVLHDGLIGDAASATVAVAHRNSERSACKFRRSAARISRL